MMKPLSEFRADTVRVLLTDIDGTLTKNGRLPQESYRAMWELSQKGLAVIPVTGRPAGWCELIARLWPVHGVVGENGAFYFRYDGKKMHRHFARGRAQRMEDRRRLREIRREVLSKVPGCAVASDQFCRLFDLAIDFAEDVSPLADEPIAQIVSIFKAYGATAKVSNIHVNGWFGDHDKVSTCKLYLEREFGFDTKAMRAQCAFVGDSPNDEPMFEFFPYSFAVSNIRKFLPSLKYKPAYVADEEESEGFCQVAERCLKPNRA